MAKLELWVVERNGRPGLCPGKGDASALAFASEVAALGEAELDCGDRVTRYVPEPSHQNWPGYAKREVWVVEDEHGVCTLPEDWCEGDSVYVVAFAEEVHSTGRVEPTERVTRYVPEPVWERWDPEKPPSSSTLYIGVFHGAPMALCRFTGAYWIEESSGTIVEAPLCYTPCPMPPEEP